MGPPLRKFRSVAIRRGRYPHRPEPAARPVGHALRRRKLHTPQGGLSWPFGPIHLLVHFRLTAKAHSFRCSSLPLCRFATSPPDRGSRPLPTRPGAQPLAALPPYGCGLPPAGTSLGSRGGPIIAPLVKGGWPEGPGGFRRPEMGQVAPSSVTAFGRATFPSGGRQGPPKAADPTGDCWRQGGHIGPPLRGITFRHRPIPNP